MTPAQLPKGNRKVTAPLLTQEEFRTAIAIKFNSNSIFKVHGAKLPALPHCVFTKVNTDGEVEPEVTLKQGDYIQVTPTVKHGLYTPVMAHLIPA